jgi:hypothetical protein
VSGSKRVEFRYLHNAWKWVQDGDLSLFALTDFVQTGKTVETDDSPLVDEADNEKPLMLEVLQHPIRSANGPHGLTGNRHYGLFAKFIK